MIINSPSSSIAFYIFNFPIKFYGITMSVAILIGILISIYFFSKENTTKVTDEFIDSIPFTVLFSIFGARLFYVLGEIEYYKNNPLEMIMINHGGISIWGAILFGFIGLYIYSKIKKINLLYYCDFYALVLPLSQAIGRWGNFFNQEAYGAPCEGIIKLYIDKSHRMTQYSNYEFYHPAFLYESILDLIIFIFLFYCFKKQNRKNGEILFIYLILYSIIRIFIENIRIDSILNINNIPVAQIISVFVLIISVFFYLKRLRNTNPS